MKDEYTFDDVLPGLEPAISLAMEEVNFNGSVAVEQARRIVQFPQDLHENEHGEAWILAQDILPGHKFSDKPVMDIFMYPFPAGSDQADYKDSVQELNTRLVTKVGSELLRPLIDAGQIHATALGVVLADGRPATYIRVFRAEDFPCSEHPEMLLGQPLGMYHCPACGEMQMAGCFHLPREFDDEGNPIDGQSEQ